MCWQFRKHGRCRQGHKCRFAHDNDLFNGAGTIPSKSDIPTGQCKACSFSFLCFVLNVFLVLCFVYVNLC